MPEGAEAVVIVVTLVVLDEASGVASGGVEVVVVVDEVDGSLVVVLAAGAVVVVVVDSVVEVLVAEVDAGVVVAADISAFAFAGDNEAARTNVIARANVFMWCHLGEECLNIQHHNCWVGRFDVADKRKTLNRN